VFDYLSKIKSKMNKAAITFLIVLVIIAIAVGEIIGMNYIEAWLGFPVFKLLLEGLFIKLPGALLGLIFWFLDITFIYASYLFFAKRNIQQPMTNQDFAVYFGMAFIVLLHHSSMFAL
jgi:hypothetical protein